MAEKTDNFVTGALDDLAQLKNLLEQAAYLTQELNNRWLALGKTNMSGYDAYNWATHPFTQQEFNQALLSLDDDLVGVNLMTINTVGPIDKVVKLGLR